MTRNVLILALSLTACSDETEVYDPPSGPWVFLLESEADECRMEPVERMEVELVVDEDVVVLFADDEGGGLEADRDGNRFEGSETDYDPLQDYGIDCTVIWRTSFEGEFTADDKAELAARIEVDLDGGSDCAYVGMEVDGSDVDLPCTTEATYAGTSVE